MATHFRDYDGAMETVIPWNAVYSLPSQSTKVTKTTPRIVPKQGSSFGPGEMIRVEIPAQGYMNGNNSVLTFDVSLTYKPADAVTGAYEGSIIRFQNNIQSIIARSRLLYGSTVLEEYLRHNLLVRALTEWSTSSTVDQTSISEGIAGRVVGFTGSGLSTTDSTDPTGVVGPKVGPINGRQAFIQGISLQSPNNAVGDFTTSGDNNALRSAGWGAVPNGWTAGGTPELVVPNGTTLTCTRRYSIQLPFGLFNQGKHLLTKYMASQLAFELILAPVEDCIYWQKGYYLNPATGYVVSPTYVSTPSYSLTNVAFIPEILEFDAIYDKNIQEGLKSGIAIKFASWNTYQFSVTTGTTFSVNVPERNRSLKGIFACQVRQTAEITKDSGAMFYSSYNSDPTVGNTLQEWQYRIGGKYFPASPVQCATAVGGSYSNGASEAYVELAKALNILGDYRLSVPMAADNWAVVAGRLTYNGAENYLLPEYDGAILHSNRWNKGASYLDYAEFPVGLPANPTTYSQGNIVARAYYGTGSCCFTMAQNLESSSGLEISGLNAQEQSDIELMARWSQSQSNGSDKTMMIVFTYYDALLILYSNNVISLVK